VFATSRSAEAEAVGPTGWIIGGVAVSRTVNRHPYTVFAASTPICCLSTRLPVTDTNTLDTLGGA
jgi:hypothetical protein